MTETTEEYDFYQAPITLQQNHAKLVHLSMYELSFDNSTLSYQKSGQGKEVLLLFHGFGQQAQAFQSLATALHHTYTLYSFDLFFHGKSRWGNGETPLEKDTWKEILTRFLLTHHIDRFSALGFSLGAKFALTTIELFPERINQAILLAPDGIKTNFWYSLATYPLVFRKFFKSMIVKPSRLTGIINVLQALKMMEKGLLRFVESQMDTAEKRERVYYSWVVFRHLKVDINTLGALIERHDIKTVLMIGRHDKVIQEKRMAKFLRTVPSCQLEILDANHRGIINASIPILQKKASV